MEINTEIKCLTSDDIKRNVKHNIVVLRKEAKLKMRDVAKALNIKENTYRIWEDPARSCPKPHDIVNLARIYNVSCDFILGNEDYLRKVNDVKKESKYNSDIKNSMHHLSELENYEKLLVMSVRRLSLEEKLKISEEITDILNSHGNI